MPHYSAAENGFFDSGKLPSDAIEITEERRVALLSAQASGEIIVADSDGYPISIPVQSPPPPDALEIATAELASRNRIAREQIAILKPAVDGGYAKPEHTQQLADWQRYRYELTLVPEQPGWPEQPQWPAEPDKVI